MDSKNEAQAVSDEPTADEQLIACLEDDAAKLKQENPDDEMAATMLEAADRIRALSAQPAVQVPQWQPIETAPKDGTRIQLYFQLIGNSKGRIEYGQWNSDKYAKKPRPYWTGDMESIFGVKRYRDNQPTHWMPLPASPTPTANPSEGAGE